MLNERIKFLLGICIITCAIGIPHNLFGIDLLSLFSVFSFLLVGLGCFGNSRFYVTLLTFVCGAIPILCLPYYWTKMELGQTLWRVILSTNSNEFLELFKHKFLYLILFLIPIVGFVTYTGVKKLFSIDIGKKFLRRIGIVGVFGIILCIKINSKNYDGNWYLSARSLQPIEYPVNLLVIIKERFDNKRFNKEHALFHFGIEKTVLDSSRKHFIVLVIGETARYDHWSLNGYERETTPRLQKVDHLYNFSNVSAPAGGTIYSIPLFMTAEDPYAYNEHYKRKGIIDAFKEGNYYTCYITNQSETRNSFLKNEYHYQEVDTFLNTKIEEGERDFKEGNYDESVFPLLNKLYPEIIEKHQNIFLCIHLLGNHEDYSKRYPISFQKWKDSSNLKHKNMFGYDKEIAQYDNSILYSDYVLDSLIHFFQKKSANASLLFLSDHGENLKDDSLKLMDHSPRPNKYLLHIPYFVWLGDSCLKYHPEWPIVLQQHQNVPLLSSECTLYTLLDLGGLKAKYFEDDQRHFSLLSADLIASPQHVFAPNFKRVTYSDLLK